jgi:hypothetical protein
MGLDMYLSKKSYVWSYNRIKLTELGLDFSKVQGLEQVKPERVSYVVEDVGYWRKANAIHNWFVKNVQDGKDDCGEYYVSGFDLQNLLDTVNDVLADPSKAHELLPSQSGFFFGSTDYDEWYFKDLKDTREIIKKVLAEGEETGSYYYRSSW